MPGLRTTQEHPPNERTERTQNIGTSEGEERPILLLHIPTMPSSCLYALENFGCGEWICLWRPTRRRGGTRKWLFLHFVSDAGRASWIYCFVGVPLPGTFSDFAFGAGRYCTSYIATQSGGLSPIRQADISLLFLPAPPSPTECCGVALRAIPYVSYRQ